MRPREAPVGVGLRGSASGVAGMTVPGGLPGRKDCPMSKRRSGFTGGLFAQPILPIDLTLLENAIPVNIKTEFILLQRHRFKVGGPARAGQSFGESPHCGHMAATYFYFRHESRSRHKRGFGAGGRRAQSVHVRLKAIRCPKRNPPHLRQAATY